MTCETCGGCTNDQCHGCGARWCSGTYLGDGCDRCPYKVAIPIPGTRGTRNVPCNGDRGHTGICHWDPRQAGRQQATENTP